jgi:hypothetical protein
MRIGEMAFNDDELIYSGMAIRGNKIDWLWKITL